MIPVQLVAVQRRARYFAIARGIFASACLAFGLATSLDAASSETATPDYSKEIKPLLKARCYACHSALKQKSGLRLDTVAPPFEVCLSELAEEAGPGYELAFFQLLKERIQPALCEGAASLDIYGLHTCVRHLQSVKTWSRGCSLLRNEIVNFLRAHLERVDAKTDIQLTIR